MKLILIRHGKTEWNTLNKAARTSWLFLRSAMWYFNAIPTDPEEVVRIKNCQVDVYEV